MQNNLFFSARLLGFAGLLPQLICLLAVFDDGTRFIALSAAYFYAALIFSFLGGFWWGLAVASPGAPQWVYGVAVVPSLIAFVSGIPWMIGTTWPGPSLGLLGICLIAALFAKPFMDSALQGSALERNQPLIIILDDSASMMADNGGERFFEMAIDRIEDILSRRGGASPTYLMAASEPGRHAEAQTTDQIAGLLGGVQPTTYHVTLDAAYRQALELVTASGWNGATVRILRSCGTL